MIGRRRVVGGGWPCAIDHISSGALIFFCFCPGGAEYSPDWTVRFEPTLIFGTSVGKMQTIVIGGGLAGLSAAHTVIERGGKVADASVFMRR